tara:strand:+ start:17 stop:1285 length:1269 start_codon:yes stop_codon:yes gene_type:complete
MAHEFAESIIPIINGCGFEPVITSSYVTTPSCSLFAREFDFLGALIITASHNPFNWLGLKIKSFRGCSVDESFTKAVMQRIKLGNLDQPSFITCKTVDVKTFHLEKIQSMFDLDYILRRLDQMRLRIFIDCMHGSAANSIDKLFNNKAGRTITGIRENNDPYFGGNPPEPLNKYLDRLNFILKDKASDGSKTLGIIFDGDGDRIAVIDEKGRYCSSQVLLPYLILNLGKKDLKLDPVLKTVSGSDLIMKISQDQNRQVLELPVGFKHIAKKMINQPIFIGGEESGGIGFGEFLPERDALYTSMILLREIAEQSKYLCDSLDEIQREYGPSFYDRIDVELKNIEERDLIESYLLKNLPKKICGHTISEIIKIDGIKFRFDYSFWLLFRFSGTEPLLRIYCEAPSEEKLNNTLEWSKEFINKAY